MTHYEISKHGRESHRRLLISPAATCPSSPTVYLSRMATPFTEPPNPSPNPGPNPNGTWTVVSRRRGRGRHNPQFQTLTSQLQTLALGPPSPWTPADSDLDPARESSLLRKIESSISRLEASQFYRRFQSQLQNPQFNAGLSRISASGSQIQMVVYGIGSIESYATPRFQLSLALLLKKELSPIIGSVEVFDPILSSTECAVIAKLGLSVMEIDEKGRREVNCPTLFYMPHCEAALYDNLLAANWRPTMLNRMVVLGNSFAEYQRSAEIRGYGSLALEGVAKRVLWVRRYVREMEMGAEDDEHELFRAFQDMSWHFFDLDDDTEMEFHL